MASALAIGTPVQGLKRTRRCRGLSQSECRDICAFQVPPKVSSFQDATALAGALLLQMIGLTDPRYSCTNNQYIKVCLILNVYFLHDISPCPSLSSGYPRTEFFFLQKLIFKFASR